MTFNTPTYLLHTVQDVGGMRSNPQPTPRYGVWDSTSLSCSESVAGAGICKTSFLERRCLGGWLRADKSLVGSLWLPVSLAQGVFAVHQEHVFLTGTT